MKQVLRVAAALCMMAGVLAGVPASAQKLPTATAPGAYLAVGGTYGEFEAQYPRQVLGGAGAYADLNLTRHLGVEFEARWLRQNQVDGSNQTTYLAGPRFELHRGRFSPYVKGLVGAAKLIFPSFDGYPTGYGTYTALAFGGGLDVNLTEKIKLRAFDFECQNWPNFTLGNGLPQQSLTPYGVSAGLSYQIYRTGGWRKHRYK